MKRSFSFFLLSLIFLISFFPLSKADVATPCQSRCLSLYNECYESKRPPGVEYRPMILTEVLTEEGVMVLECDVDRTICRFTNLTLEDLKIPECEELVKECSVDCQRSAYPKSCGEGCYSFSTLNCVPPGYRVLERGMPVYCSLDGVLDM